MNNGSEQKFTFFPRPEAHSMKWDELLPPLRRAVRDLLLRLDGAVNKVDQSISNPKEFKGGEITANCFLVYGERGTGKTTVLLSARDAVCGKCDNFFVPLKEETDKKKSLREYAQRSAVELKGKGIVWLDVLDMESMPLHANLLTTMLTRVRNAICSPGFENKSLESTSILEEGAESARHKLEQLIKDATLMWEDIEEPDTRNRANRQVAAADIYAQFRERFEDAMKTLSKELGRRSGRSDTICPIILPIDNIDRSTDHLYNIVKLAQMVACPSLWLVMAGDREDVETFLERAYWKELISIGGGAGGAGKTGLRGEDEALVMARRQAAAASHKLLPPSHRIEVNLAKPKDVLFFSPSRSPKNDPTLQIKSDEGRCIYDLLQKVVIPNVGAESTINLAQLFYARDFVETGEGKTTTSEENFDPKYLTHTARFALHLPARGVLDLWQLAHWVVEDNTSFPEKATFKAHHEDDFRAEKIVRTMLRNIITESAMSSGFGRALQDRIISRDSFGATILDFLNPNPMLKVHRTRDLSFEYRSHPSEIANSEYVVRSTVSAKGREEVVLFFLTYKSSDWDEKLPSLVAAWLAVLHDVLGCAPRSWVFGSPDKKNMLVLVSHEVVVSVNGKCPVRKESKELWWPAPDWVTFLAQDVFAKRWEQFRSSLENKDPSLACAADSVPRLMAAGWVACVLNTFYALAFPSATKEKNGGDIPHCTGNVAEGKNSLAQTRKPDEMPNKGNKQINVDKGWTKDDEIQAFETEVMKAAADLYWELTQCSGTSRKQVFFARDERNGVTSMVDIVEWLERKLPLLLGHLYVPMDANVATDRMNNIAGVVGVLKPQGGTLADAWKANWPYILADVETVLKDLFAVEEVLDKTPSENKPTQQKIPPYIENLDLLGPFANLHKFW